MDLYIYYFNIPFFIQKRIQFHGQGSFNLQLEWRMTLSCFLMIFFPLASITFAGCWLPINRFFKFFFQTSKLCSQDSFTISLARFSQRWPCYVQEILSGSLFLKPVDNVKKHPKDLCLLDWADQRAAPRSWWLLHADHLPWLRWDLRREGREEGFLLFPFRDYWTLTLDFLTRLGNLLLTSAVWITRAGEGWPVLLSLIDLSRR